MPCLSGTRTVFHGFARDAVQSKHIWGIEMQDPHGSGAGQGDCALLHAHLLWHQLAASNAALCESPQSLMHTPLTCTAFKSAENTASDIHEPAYR